MRIVTIYRPSRSDDSYGGSIEDFSDSLEAYGMIGRDKERTVLLVRREVEILPGYHVLDGVHADWKLADQVLYRVTGQVETFNTFGWKRVELEKAEKPLHPGV